MSEEWEWLEEIENGTSYKLGEVIPYDPNWVCIRESKYQQLISCIKAMRKSLEEIQGDQADDWMAGHVGESEYHMYSCARETLARCAEGKVE